MAGRERKRDIGWDHAIKVDDSRFKTKCKWCGHVMSSGGITRLKIHLAGIGGNATACTECPDEVKMTMRELVRNVQTSCSSKSKSKTVEPNFDHSYDAVQQHDNDVVEDTERDELLSAGLQNHEDAGNSSPLDIPISLNQGSRLRVAYQGAPGAFSEEVAEKAYANCETIPYEQFQYAFDAVERWLADRVVLPIENSLGGSIHRNYDLLLHHKLQVVGEVYYGVRYCLLANHGVEIADLKRVLSHPHALAQCENVLTKLGVIRETVHDTAIAAQFIAAQKFQEVGAIASSRAAEIYGLNILAHDIQEEHDNITRFLVLAREPVVPGTDKPFKTSIVFCLDEGPHALLKAVAVFSTRQINITKIESRPLWKRPKRKQTDNNDGLLRCSEYLFYVDFDASMADLVAQNALRNLKEFASSVRVLGSYPKWV